MASKNATRKQTEITAVAIFRVNDKSGKCLGYLVPSDTEGQEAYEVTYNYTLHRYECNCKCGIECNHTKECKHLRAVKEVVEARKQVATPAYDVVGAALTVVNRAMADAKIGTCYDDMAEEKAQRIEAVKAAYAEAQNSGLAESYKASWYPNTAA